MHIIGAMRELHQLRDPLRARSLASFSSRGPGDTRCNSDRASAAQLSVPQTLPYAGSLLRLHTDASDRGWLVDLQLVGSPIARAAWAELLRGSV